MKIKNKNIHHIKFKHSKLVHEFELEGYYDNIYGKAIAYEDDEMDNQIEVGSIEGSYIDVESLNEPVHELLDSISGDHVRYSKYFNEYNKIDKKTRKLLNLGDEDVDIMRSSFVYIHKLKVQKKYRGLGIGKTLVQTMINDYKRESSIAFLTAAPLQFNSSDPSTKETFKKRNEKESKKKLIELYESYGFHNIPYSDGDMVIYIGDWFI
jgi:ribosomal protein S18 acetylase RimI-like enzyme